MKKLAMFGILVSALVLLLAIALPVHAEVTTNEISPYDLDVFVPCANGGAGEWVHFSGELHELVVLTINDNNFTFKRHRQPKGLTGVGLVTGDKYQATGVTQ